MGEFNNFFDHLTRIRREYADSTIHDEFIELECPDISEFDQDIEYQINLDKDFMSGG